MNCSQVVFLVCMVWVTGEDVIGGLDMTRQQELREDGSRLSQFKRQRWRTRWRNKARGTTSSVRYALTVPLAVEFFSNILKRFSIFYYQFLNYFIHNKISKQSQRRFEINNRYTFLVNSEKQAFLATHEYLSV